MTAYNGKAAETHSKLTTRITLYRIFGIKGAVCKIEKRVNFDREFERAQLSVPLPSLQPVHLPVNSCLICGRIKHEIHQIHRPISLFSKLHIIQPLYLTQTVNL